MRSLLMMEVAELSDVDAIALHAMASMLDLNREVLLTAYLKANPARAHELRSQGPKLKEVASALGVSTSTVKRYLVEG